MDIQYGEDQLSVSVRMEREVWESNGEDGCDRCVDRVVGGDQESLPHRQLICLYERELDLFFLFILYFIYFPDTIWNVGSIENNTAIA